VRRHRTAASEQAHVRDAWPIVVPEVPYRVPADALAQVTTRQEDTQSWTRGTRVIAWIASRSTTRTIVPRPGTEWSRYKGWASGGLAVGTRGHATSRSHGS